MSISRYCSYRIIVKGNIWQRERQGLFDYTQRSATSSFSLTISDSCILYQQEGTILVAPNQESLPVEGARVLAWVDVVNGLFQLKSPWLLLKHCVQHPESLWLVVKNLPRQSFALSVGDTVRVGGVQLRVRQLVTSRTGEEQSLKQPDNGKLKNLQELSRLQTADACKICMCESDGPSNPLIHPCKCSGSMGLVHTQCLQEWLCSKAEVRQNDLCTSYSWENIECEICKQEYPEQAFVNGMTIDLLPITKPEGPHAVLSRDLRNKAKQLFVLTPGTRQVVRLGRGNDSDMKVSDISVSRNHAFLHFKRTCLLLEDQQSKFGTLVKMRHPRPFELNQSFSVQAASTVISFHPKEQTHWFSCFNCCCKDPELRNIVTESQEM